MICFECIQIIKAGCIICEAVVLPEAFEVKSRVCKQCIDTVVPLATPSVLVADFDESKLQEAVSSVETIAPLALAALVEASMNAVDEPANDGAQEPLALLPPVEANNVADPFSDHASLVSKFMTYRSSPDGIHIVTPNFLY